MSEPLTRQVWRALDGPAATLDRCELTGPRVVLPSAYDVTGLAVASVAAASLAVAEVAARVGTSADVVVDSGEACAAFVAERLFRPLGWELPAPWDPIAGDYPTSDGWIRLHTNYRHHRAAATRALGLPPDADRAPVAAAVLERASEELEEAVVDAGGCAAALRERTAWLAHPAGSAAARLPLVDLDRAATASGFRPAGGPPLAGLRVVDLTRVIAGPTSTRFLAAYGADVLRVDPPGFAEVPALLPITTEGKRCAELDLATAAGTDRLLALLEDAHVLVHGLRPGAMEGLGLGAEVLAERYPSLVVGSLSAYGTTGPWGRRRGFDSLVQMSTGIVATETTRARSGRPTALPAQALDHATGYLLAAGICRLLAEGRAGTVTTALAATAHLLCETPVPEETASGLPDPPSRVERGTSWGPALATPVPGRLLAVPTVTPRAAGPLGRDLPAWG